MCGGTKSTSQKFNHDTSQYNAKDSVYSPRDNPSAGKIKKGKISVINDVILLTLQNRVESVRSNGKVSVLFSTVSPVGKYRPSALPSDLSPASSVQF